MRVILQSLEEQLGQCDSKLKPAVLSQLALSRNSLATMIVLEEIKLPTKGSIEQVQAHVMRTPVAHGMLIGASGSNKELVVVSYSPLGNRLIDCDYVARARARPAMAGLSNLILVVLNVITTFVGGAIAGFGAWLATRDPGECLQYMHSPILVFGCCIMAFSLLALCAAFFKMGLLLRLYLLLMFALICGLLVFALFTFVVTHKFTAKTLSNLGYKQYRLADFSDWLQSRVHDASRWSRIRACLRDFKMCFYDLVSEMQFLSKAVQYLAADTYECFDFVNLQFHFLVMLCTYVLLSILCVLVSFQILYSGSRFVTGSSSGLASCSGLSLDQIQEIWFTGLASYLVLKLSFVIVFVSELDWFLVQDWLAVWFWNYHLSL
ncbi:hypothetical protein L7F22_064396 [Adiantum nelumboides]|nr:hypothetical protein [Adiantum nelumboides]